MNSRHTRRLTIALGLVLTIAALVAPSANAKMQPVYSDHGVALVPVSSEPRRIDRLPTSFISSATSTGR